MLENLRDWAGGLEGVAFGLGFGGRGGLKVFSSVVMRIVIDRRFLQPEFICLRIVTFRQCVMRAWRQAQNTAEARLSLRDLIIRQFTLLIRAFPNGCLEQSLTHHVLGPSPVLQINVSNPSSQHSFHRESNAVPPASFGFAASTSSIMVNDQ